LAGGDVVFDDDAGPLEPEAVTFVAEVLELAAGVFVFAGADGVDGDVVAEGADLVARFGDEGGAGDVEGDVVREVD
jgi:hypothetical protein